MVSAPDRKPRHTWRRRLFRLLALGLAALLLFIGWLLLPVSRPAYPLLTRMPPGISLGLEARGSTHAWRMLEGERMPERIAALPLVRALGKEHGYTPAALLQKARGISSRINSVLAQPFDTDIVSRCLSGSIAFACMDAYGKEAILLATPDNMAWSAMKLGLLLAGKKSENGLVYLEPDKQANSSSGPEQNKKFFITISRGLIVGATSLRLLHTACTAVAGMPAATGATAALSPSLTILFRPTAEMRQQLQKKIGTSLNIIGQLVLHVTPEKNGFSATANGRMNPAVMTALLAEAAAVRSQRNLPAPRFTREQLPASGPGFSAKAEGFLHPELAWRALGHKLWDTPARPLRGRSRPMTILLREWLDRGVIAHADGRFRLCLSPASIPMDELKGVPPAPVISTAWGVRENSAAFTSFNRGLRKIVDYYRSPGGSTLYQKVREDTRMELAGQSGRIFLQPLFFNHMSPAWRFNRSIAEFTTQHSTWTTGRADTHRPANHRTLHQPTRSPGTDKAADSGQRLAEITYEWHLDERFCNQMRGLIRDKVVEHGFAAQKQQAQIMKGVDLLLAFARSINDVSGSVSVTRIAEKKPDFPFHLQLRVILPPQASTSR